MIIDEAIEYTKKRREELEELGYTPSVSMISQIMKELLDKKFVTFVGGIPVGGVSTNEGVMVYEMLL